MEFTYQLTIRSPYKRATPGRCLKCGCTEEFACDGGCAWADAEKTFCTACLPGFGSMVLLHLVDQPKAARRKGARR